MDADLQEATLKRRVSTLVEVIAAADSHYIPRIRPRAMQKVWMTREIRKAIKHRNSLRRQVATIPLHSQSEINHNNVRQKCARQL